MQGHCCVCRSSIERSLQVVCVCPVLVFNLSIKHEVVLGQGWGSVVRCWGPENHCSNVAADSQCPESIGCGDFPCISGEGINVMKMNVIKIQKMKNFLRLEFVITWETCVLVAGWGTSSREKEAWWSLELQCVLLSQCLCTLFFDIHACEVLVPLLILLQVSQYFMLFLIWHWWSQEAVFKNLSFPSMKIIRLETDKKVGF